jgi:hypothetical protein
MLVMPSKSHENKIDYIFCHLNEDTIEHVEAEDFSGKIRIYGHRK